MGKIKRMQNFIDWWETKVKGSYIEDEAFVNILEKI